MLSITQLLVWPTADGCLTPLVTTDQAVPLQVRDLRLQLPPSCSNATMAALFPNIASPFMLPLCSAATFVEWVDGAGPHISPMCGRDATCTDEPIANISTAPTSPRCSCTGDAYTPDWLDAFDSSLAPYLSADTYTSTTPYGCLVPIRATVLAYGAPIEISKMRISLTKNHISAESQALNLTLTLSGSDWFNGSNCTWTLDSTLPWVYIVRKEGSVTALAGSDHAVSTVPILVQSAGLRDGSTTGVVAIHFMSHSSVQGRSLSPQVVNMAMTVYVSAVAVVATSSFGNSSAHASLGVGTFFLFIARDVNGFQLSHSEVTRFSANLTFKVTGEIIPTHLAYTYNGMYTVSVTPPYLGAYVLHMTLVEAGVPRKLPSTMHVEVDCPEPTERNPNGDGCGCGPGTAPDGNSGCAACLPGSFAPSVGNDACIRCLGDHVTSKLGADSVADCVCASLFFNDTSVTHGAWCVGCTDGEPCGLPGDAVPGVTLASLHLSVGRWRLSNMTKDIRACAGMRIKSPCISGIEPYCAAGFYGPKCLLCSEPGHFVADGTCSACPDKGAAIGTAMGVLTGVGLTLGLIRTGLRLCGPRWIDAVERGGATAARLGLVPKLKLLLGYYQVVVAMPEVFLVPLPSEYKAAMRVFHFIHFEWLSMLVPAACIGDYGLRLALDALMPLLVLALLILGGVLRQLTAHTVSSRPNPSLLPARVSVGAVLCNEHGRIATGALNSMPWVFLFCFAVAPAVSSRIFSAWACDRFGYDDRDSTHWYYLHADYALRCSYGSDVLAPHEAVKAVAYPLVVLWPLGAPLFFWALLRYSRASPHNQQLARAIAFLRVEYVDRCWYWEVAELCRKEVRERVPAAIAQERIDLLHVPAGARRLPAAGAAAPQLPPPRLCPSHLDWARRPTPCRTPLPKLVDRLCRHPD